MNAHVYDEAITQALSAVAQDMARYGSSSGIDDFSTEDLAEEFRDALSLRYPPEGYGTWSSRAQPGHGGRFFVFWHVNSCE